MKYKTIQCKDCGRKVLKKVFEKKVAIAHDLCKKCYEKSKRKKAQDEKWKLSID